jgi:hypothetical protein
LAAERGAERDQVILRGRLRLLEFPPPAVADGARDQEETKRAQDGNDTESDQDIAQHV